MEMKFKGLEFKLDNEKIYLTNLMDFAKYKEGEDISLYKFVECQLAGENHPMHCGGKQLNCSETKKLIYNSYAIVDGRLEIINKTKDITIITTFESFEDTNVIKVSNYLYNDSNKEVVIESLSSLRFAGIGENGSDSLKNIYLHKFTNSWHVECQVKRESLWDSMLYNGNTHSFKRVLVSNTGSWSTKEYIPQAILEDTDKGKFLFFQIESSTSWEYEISDETKHIYLNAGGANMTDHDCSIRVAPGGSFTTKPVAFCVGNSINECLGEMTKYRRHLLRDNYKDRDLPIIFNEYMHLSWDGPNEDRTARIAEAIKDFGISYYVIDCGWHDECNVDDIYKSCGEWLESSVRFPKGVRKTISKLKTFSLKTGLWIEPEIIGYTNEKMISYYGEDAFFKRNGRPVIMASRMFLDFRNPKVIKYLNSAIDRMVSEFGASYIKMDYNQDCGYGTETNATTLGEGLLLSSQAYKDWIHSITAKYPDVIIETCSSGGCRMDYETLSSFSLCSTSDQTNFQKYPYISSNILSAVLPEQAGVWSYPVDCICGANEFDEGVKELIDSKISKEQVAMNMINALLGRMHLASCIHLLSEEKQEIVKEGIRYYKEIVAAKKSGVPYLPLGFSHFGDTHVSSGFISNKKLYLAVWNLHGDKEFNIPITDYAIKEVTLRYPSFSEAKVSFTSNNIKVNFKNELDSCFLEVVLS